MPAKFKAHDERILRDALSRWGSSGSNRAAHALRGDLAKILRLAQDIGADLGHGALSCFAALAAGTAPFMKAIEHANPEDVDRALDRAAWLAGARPAREAPAGSSAKLTLLQWCSGADLEREAAALLERGANPNLYNAGGTAIGMAAYSGSGRVLARMLAFGADAALHLPAEHAPGAPHSAGSTLLHRVCERPIPNLAKIAAMLAWSPESYPDLHCRTDDGLTPMDKAKLSRSSDLILALSQAIAGREAEAIAKNIPLAQPRSRATL